MGVSPRGTDDWLPPSDSVRELADDLTSTVELVGEQVGGVNAEVYATASSSNVATTQIAVEVASLRTRVAELESATPSHKHSQDDITGLTVVLEGILRRLQRLENPPA